METLKKLLEFELIVVEDYNLKVYSFFTVLLILVITKLILWLIKKALFQKQRLRKIDEGNAYALFQIITYSVWIVSIIFLLETIGIQVTVLLAGSAALLVGIGLGLQQTFNDIISGIILLSERSIKIGDVLEINDDIVKIHSIGLRTSEGFNRDNISIIIPNSLITSDKVINWSHQVKKTRFKITVGVAYGSDINLVLKVLEESPLEHDEITDKKSIEAQLIEFNSSSLDFQLLFYTEHIFRIGKIKSDIRRIIYRKFMENNITIPYPQMDVYMNPKTDLS